MRKISASYIFTLNGPILKNGIVVVDEHNGTIAEVIDTGGQVTEIAGLEYYSGILAPGFVNAHCHLELSHLKRKLTPHRQLAFFLDEIARYRSLQSEETQIYAARTADRLMYTSGIVAVGDVSNSSLTLQIKSNSPIYYHTFIECFGFLPERAVRSMAKGEELFRLFSEIGQACSLTPHAPYSVSDELFHLIGRHARDNRSILSLHHQESEAENELFMSKSGELVDHYTETLGLDLDFWEAPKSDATRVSLSKLPENNPLLLVHNTWLTHELLEPLNSFRKKENTFLVLCPKANLFIGNRLPDIDLIRKAGFPVCIGTDSLASNDTLSVIEELKTIQLHFNIPLIDLLTWACKNGARAIQIDQWAGSIEVGKRPGLNLISGVDLNQLFLTPQSKVKKII